MLKNKIKKISVISALSILLASGLGFGAVRMIAPLPIFGGDIPATTQAVDNTKDTATEANGAAEANETANESASEKEQGENLSGGGHQDQDNVNIDNQFEGVQ
ncbi:MAG: hypothetical protein ACYCXB_05910 [Candidatus Humimicrobiaceae bacterium]